MDFNSVNLFLKDIVDLNSNLFLMIPLLLEASFPEHAIYCYTKCAVIV